MNQIIIILFITLVFLYFFFIRYTIMKRRHYIKNMEIDDHIINTIDELKNEIKNNHELKSIQNKLRIISFFKDLLYSVSILFAILSPYAYFYFKIYKNEEIPTIQNVYFIMAIYFLFLIISIITILQIEKYSSNQYIKNKIIIKNYIFNNFIKKIKTDIKWIEGSILISNVEEKYRNASFNKIQEDNRNDSEDDFYLVRFEDYNAGTYKDKYNISLFDYKENVAIDKYNIIEGKNIRRRGLRLKSGVFGIVSLSNSIPNDIRITSNKKSIHFLEKPYRVTTMPEDFNKNFIILAKDGYKISEMISKKTLDILKDFYNNSKMKFDISIRNNEIYFRFHTIDMMELNIVGNIIDDMMLKEYANIVLFITKISEEINNNWKVVK